MRAFLVLSAVVALSFAQTPRSRIEDGRYYPSDDGQYHPDNSGAYNGANDGSYHPDNSGAYNPDDSGAYRGSYEKYIHQADQFGGSGGSGGGVAYSGGVRRPGTFVVSVQPARTGAVVTGTRTGTFATGTRTGSVGLVTGTRTGSVGTLVTGTGSGFVDGGAAVYRGAVSASRQGSASGLYDNRNYAIIRKEEDVRPDGYHYVYETENKILGEEQGKLANVGTDNEAMQANGYFEYTGPDNVVYRVDYTANENGFNPSAAHLPTPPPIPEAILRSLEYQRSIGEL